MRAALIVGRSVGRSVGRRYLSISCIIVPAVCPDRVRPVVVLRALAKRLVLLSNDATTMAGSIRASALLTNPANKETEPRMA